MQSSHSLINLLGGIGSCNSLSLERCSLRSSRHFLTGMLVYRDLMSKLANFLPWMLIFLSLWSRSPEFLMWVGLMVPSRGVRIFASSLAIL